VRVGYVQRVRVGVDQSATKKSLLFGRTRACFNPKARSGA
jgi:hypothetical protein